MATDHLKNTFTALVQNLEDSTDLEDVLYRVYPFYAYGHSSYAVEPGRLTISVIVLDSDAEDPFTNENTQTDLLPTEFLIAVDTVMGNDSEMWISEDRETMLDYEYKVLRALQENSHWNTTSDNQGWTVSSIERNVPVIEEDGGINPEIFRIEITIVVEIYLDLTDGPAR